MRNTNNGWFRWASIPTPSICLRIRNKTLLAHAPARAFLGRGVWGPMVSPSAQRIGYFVATRSRAWPSTPWAHPPLSRHSATKKAAIAAKSNVSCTKILAYVQAPQPRRAAIGQKRLPTIEPRSGDKTTRSHAAHRGEKPPRPRATLLPHALARGRTLSRHRHSTLNTHLRVSLSRRRGFTW